MKMIMNMIRAKYGYSYELYSKSLVVMIAGV